ncbi:uncharacterized protein [Nicotiana sylvestris]|uniref:C2H2-type domain-containing protein n=2 Tax=Nicotiana TaxID=4085 RepID=A0A1S4BL06_TOBAC|nr:PREDICTED: uncharacterized protein LOC104223396 [Nicotiana sylvestris]XP_016489566.1 PREDICTED: uncharacterized protein LOC107809444 [Nicotiana tabacum]
MQAGGIGGTLFYQCIICSKYFDSSQGLAGHSKGHLGHGWKKGTSHRKVFLPYNPIYLQQQRQQQQQQGCGSVAVSTDSSPLPINVAPQLPIIMQPQQAAAAGSVASRESNVVAKPKPKPKADQPQNVASSSSRVGPPRKKHYLRFRDMKILARLTPRLAKEEQEIILRLVDCAMDQAKQAKMKNIDVEVIQNKDSAAADGIRTSTKKDVVTVEDSGDESKNM